MITHFSRDNYYIFQTLCFPNGLVFPHFQLQNIPNSEYSKCRCLKRQTPSSLGQASGLPPLNAILKITHISTPKKALLVSSIKSNNLGITFAHHDACCVHA